jgi:hypothetical protein
MSVFQIVSRVLMFGLTAVVCAWLTSKFGGLRAMGLWALALAVVCGGTALLMNVQPPGRITPINYLAGVVLPWGYKIGRGKLLPIVVASWLGWVVAGLAVIVLRTRVPGVTMPAMLFASWIIAALVVLRLVTMILTRGNSNPIAPGTLTPIVALGALLIASIAMVIFGRSETWTNLALLLTGGPILFLGGGYLLWLGAVLTIGRNARWN